VAPDVAAEPARPRSVSRTEVSTLLALTVLALALRVTSLSRSLYTDEAYSLALAQRGFGHMFGLFFGYEPNGTPYSILLWPLIRIFGTGPALLRLPAVLGGTASVPALWWAARRFATPAAALLAAGLLAINPMAVWYGQEARSYAFVLLAVCLAFGALPHALDRGRRRRAWVGYVAAMVALAYCELFAVPLVLPAQALIAWRRGRPGLRRWAWSLLAVLVCCAPLLVGAAIARSHRNALYWAPKTYRALITFALQEITAGLSGVSALRWATLLGGVALLAAAVVWIVRRGATPAVRGTLAMAICWGVVPAAVLLAISFVQPVFWPRYVILSLPGLCLALALAAELLWHSRRGVLVAGACLAVLAVAAVVADARQRTAVQESWKTAAAWLSAERAPDQPTIVDTVSVLPSLGYYDPAFRASDGDLVVQEWQDQPLPAGVAGYKDRGGWGTVPDGPPTVHAFERLARIGHGTVWMVVAEIVTSLQGEVSDGAAVAWARAHCRVQARQLVEVWVMRASDCAVAGAAGVGAADRSAAAAAAGASAAQAPPAPAPVGVRERAGGARRDLAAAQDRRGHRLREPLA
jgi:hypothetical protein